jgi:hypothetical protein
VETFDFDLFVVQGSVDSVSWFSVKGRGVHGLRFQESGFLSLETY